MRRGLKAAHAARTLAARPDSSIFPDEEGTERLFLARADVSPHDSSIFPDEEGTERPQSRRMRLRVSRTAASSPMRRGLKGKSSIAHAVAAAHSSIFPDEEGTERTEAHSSHHSRRTQQHLPR